jgi:acyl-CoA reductase-like NAD-dependent aldehyde dehydrogenase
MTNFRKVWQHTIGSSNVRPMVDRYRQRGQHLDELAARDRDHGCDVGCSRDKLRRFMRPTRRHVALPFRLGSARIEYQPLVVVVSIVAPWNYPVSLSL